MATSAVYSTTSTLVVGDDGTALVVDPAVTAHEIAGLSAAIAQRGWHPVAVWSTHGHWDHVLDGAGLHALVRWRGGPDRDDATDRLDAAARARAGDAELARALAGTDDAAPDVVAAPPVPFPRRDGDRLDWVGPSIAVVEHTGHAVDHSALVVVHAGVLVCGDLLSDVEVPLLETAAADPVGDYRTALDALEAAAAEHDVSAFVPGHGTPGDRDELDRRLAADRAYLERLDAAVTGTVSGVPDDARLTSAWVAAAHADQVAALRSRGT